jgi:dTDP-glucose 4,6-dehydratase
MGANSDSIEYVEDRKGHDFRYSVNCEKAKSELGYEPKVNFQTGLLETIDWYKNNEKWWRPLTKAQN